MLGGKAGQSLGWVVRQHRVKPPSSPSARRPNLCREPAGIEGASRRGQHRALQPRHVPRARTRTRGRASSAAHRAEPAAGRHSAATPALGNGTHPSALLPGLYLRRRGGRHGPGHMAAKEEEGRVPCASWRETSVAHMLYTRLPSAVFPPESCFLWFPSHFYPQHRAQQLRTGSQAQFESQSPPGRLPPARFLHQTAHLLPGTHLRPQPVPVAQGGWKSSDPSPGVTASCLHAQTSRPHV